MAHVCIPLKGFGDYAAGNALRRPGHYAQRRLS
jgi:hypothetical protein